MTTTARPRVRVSNLSRKQMTELAHAWGKQVDVDLEDTALRMYWKLGPSHEVVPASLLEWSEMMGDIESRRVGYDEVVTKHGYVKVSTVFLGLDHGFGARGIKELFETMTFGGNADQVLIARYATWEAAERGHKVTVNRLKNGLTPS